MCDRGFDLLLFRRFFKKNVLNRIEPQDFSNPTEAAPVNRQSAQVFQRSAMFRCWVTLVRCKAVASVQCVELEHVRVSRCLCNYRSGRNAGGKSIAVNDPALRRGTLGNPSGIYQHKIWKTR